MAGLGLSRQVFQGWFHTDPATPTSRGNSWIFAVGSASWRALAMCSVWVLALFSFAECRQHVHEPIASEEGKQGQKGLSMTPPRLGAYTRADKRQTAGGFHGGIVKGQV